MISEFTGNFTAFLLPAIFFISESLSLGAVETHDTEVLMLD